MAKVSRKIIKILLGDLNYQTLKMHVANTNSKRYIYIYIITFIYSKMYKMGIVVAQWLRLLIGRL